MSAKFKYSVAWITLLTTALIVFTITAIPVWLIQPFAPQTENALRTSYFLKAWSPILTVAALLSAIALIVFLWLNSRRWFAKAFLFLPLIVILPAFGSRGRTILSGCLIRSRKARLQKRAKLISSPTTIWFWR